MDLNTDKLGVDSNAGDVFGDAMWRSHQRAKESFDKDPKSALQGVALVALFVATNVFACNFGADIINKGVGLVDKTSVEVIARVASYNDIKDREKRIDDRYAANGGDENLKRIIKENVRRAQVAQEKRVAPPVVATID